MTKAKRPDPPATNDAQSLLASLHELYCERDAYKLRHKELVDSIIPDQVKQQLADLELEFAPSFDAIEQAIKNAEDALRAAVIAQGKTEASEHLQAVFVNGRVKWNDERLTGYATTHLEVLAFREEGQPSVRIVRK